MEILHCLQLETHFLLTLMQYSALDIVLLVSCLWQYHCLFLNDASMSVWFHDLFSELMVNMRSFFSSSDPLEQFKQTL